MEKQEKIDTIKIMFSPDAMRHIKEYVGDVLDMNLGNIQNKDTIFYATLYNSIDFEELLNDIKKELAEDLEDEGDESEEEEDTKN
jgi:hypothetical protein